jgi:hypothetical protein
MIVLRLIILLLLLGGLVCFAAYVVTGRARWRLWGVRLVKWAVLAGLCFFAGLALVYLAEAS